MHPTPIPFTRVTGAGNDFIALVEPPFELASDTVVSWCRRGLSLGADGVFILKFTDDGAKLVYYNADGSRADLCVNATRCAAQLVFQKRPKTPSVILHTDAGPIRAERLSATSARISPPNPRGLRPQNLEFSQKLHSGFFLNTGVPHWVLPMEKSLTNAPVKEWGAAGRNHHQFKPAGANIDFVRYGDAHSLEIRTYERGVEGETLACGTGVLAAVAVGVLHRNQRFPIQCLTAGGFEFIVNGVLHGEEITSWTLEGDARILTEGEIQPAASKLPNLASWSP